jgi:hypothetical protein
MGMCAAQSDVPKMGSGWTTPDFSDARNGYAMIAAKRRKRERRNRMFRKMNSFAPTFLSAASRSKANPIALPIAAIAMAIVPALARASDGAEAGYALMIVACVPLWLIGIVVLYRQRANLLRICLFGVVPVLLGCLKPVLFPPALLAFFVWWTSSAGAGRA